MICAFLAVEIAKYPYDAEADKDKSEIKISSKSSILLNWSDIYSTQMFTDSSETVNEMYNSKKLSTEAGTDITDEDIDQLYSESEEEGVEYEDPMNEVELEKMFQQVENEFK